MTLRQLFWIALVGLTSPVWSAPNAESLRAIGCTVTEKNGEIVELSADAGKFGEAEFRQIGQCSSLRKLTLNGKTLNETTLPLLSGLTALEELSTNQSQLPDDGYRHFTNFVHLRSLALWHPSWALKTFTGAGLAALKPLTELRRLTYAGSTAGDAALESVAQLTQLREFSTWHTAQTQAGHEHLVALTNLTSLKLGQRLPAWGQKPPPSLDDTTIATLLRMTSLETLELMEARLTGKTLARLQELPRLVRLIIHTTDISEAEIEALQVALPRVTIVYRPLSEEDRTNTLVKKLAL